MKVRLLVTALFAFSTINAANLLTNGDFENEPNFGAGFAHDAGFTGFTGNEIPGWTIDACCGATVHNSTLYPHISGVYSVNMDGEGHNGHNANLYQDFASLLGTLYDFSYDWQGWQNNTASRLDVTITDLVTAAVLYHGNFDFSASLQHVDAVLVGTGNNLRLRLQESPESGVNDNKFMVDNFSVVSEAPEPSTYGLTALALGLAGFVARRRR